MIEVPGQDEPGAWLAAVVHNSFDAILSKTLDGIITSWNSAAERLFGFSSEEAIGQSITIIIPPDRLHEEETILGRLRRGETVERFETIRRHRDGELIDIELTVSPVRDAAGRIIGASKIARDITERRKRRHEQELMLGEMHHRVKNLLAVVQSLAALSRRNATTVEGFVEDFSQRIGALASAHQLVLLDPQGVFRKKNTSLHAILEALLTPYSEGGRTTLEGADPMIGERSLTNVALLFHELITNAVKHGALSSEVGHLRVLVESAEGATTVLWQESGGNEPAFAAEGFGSGLMRMALGSLAARFDREWTAGVLTIRIELPDLSSSG